MKKYFMIGMMAFMCLSLAACGETDALDVQTNAEPAESIVQISETQTVTETIPETNAPPETDIESDIQETEAESIYVPAAPDYDILAAAPGCCPAE